MWPLDEYFSKCSIINQKFGIGKLKSSIEIGLNFDSHGPLKKSMMGQIM
jgi:hypothetical protein